MSTRQLSAEVKQYILLVHFLLDREADGALTAEQVGNLLTADSRLYANYLASDRDGLLDMPPLRAAQAVAEIQSRIAAHHPQIADETNRIVGQPSQTTDGVMRYFALIAFLEKKERSGELASEGFEALVAIDPELHRQYLRMTTEGASIDIRNARASVSADAIYRQMKSRYSELAKEFDQASSKRLR